MRLEVLHLDESLTRQGGFLTACAERDARFVEACAMARRIRLWGYDPDIDRLAGALPKREAPTLTFLGSGDFHHVTALLIEQAAEQVSEPFTVIHLDNHPDWVRIGSGMHCGSWVNRALKVPQVAKLITIGVCSKDLQNPEWKGGNLDAMAAGRLEIFPYRQNPSAVSRQYGEGPGFRQRGRRIYWKLISETGLEAFSDTLLTRIGTDSVYITLDKDVLAAEDAVTNWDQGRLRLDEVETLIASIGGRHRVIGADVIGDYSPVAYEGGIWPIIRKTGEGFIDHARVRLAPAAIAAKNEAANLRLLDCFAKIMG